MFSGALVISLDQVVSESPSLEVTLPETPSCKSVTAEALSFYIALGMCLLLEQTVSESLSLNHWGSKLRQRPQQWLKLHHSLHQQLTLPHWNEHCLRLHHMSQCQLKRCDL